MSAPPQGHAAAGKLAQLLGETIVHHAPWTADINEEAKWRHTEQWLEELERHTAGQVGPMLQKILDASDPPDEIRALIDEAINPPAQFSAILEQIFLYGIVSNIIGTSVQPFLQGVSNDLSAAAVADGISRPTDPSIIATAVGRGLNLGDAPTVTVPDWAYQQAAQNGMSRDDINLAASIVGMPPALQELFEMLRRGIITSDQLEQGLREGDFRDDWIQYAVQLEHAWLTPLDFVRAAVQDQMSYSDAQAWAYKTGLDTTTSVPLDTGGTEATPDMFGLAFATAGRPPGPEQLARMALRGIIDWDGTGAGATTFQQGIAESDLKTKWTSALQSLSQYLPPPREVGTLLERGVITSDQAKAYWEAGGVPTALSTAYAAMSTQQSTVEEKLLAKGEILTGYFDGIFDDSQATELLGLLGYEGDVAKDMLAIADFRRDIQAINTVVRRVATMYETFKLSATNAQAALEGAGLTNAQATNLLQTWELLRVTPIRLPSSAEIGMAVKYGTITQQQGLDALAELGYQPRDAAIVLSAHAELQVTPLPAAGTTVTG